MKATPSIEIIPYSITAIINCIQTDGKYTSFHILATDDDGINFEKLWKLVLRIWEKQPLERKDHNIKEFYETAFSDIRSEINDTVKSVSDALTQDAYVVRAMGECGFSIDQIKSVMKKAIELRNGK